MFSIRMTQFSDAVALPDIEASADKAFLAIPQLAWVATAGGLTVESHQSFIRDAYSIVAVDERDAPTGFLVATQHRTCLHIDGLAVRQQRQGQGIGRSLLARAIEDAKREGFACITLTTFRALRWNQYFYQQAGFQVIAQHALTERLKGLLSDEARHGFRRETRCAMLLSLTESGHGMTG